MLDPEDVLEVASGEDEQPVHALRPHDPDPSFTKSLDDLVERFRNRPLDSELTGTYPRSLASRPVEKRARHPLWRDSVTVQMQVLRLCSVFALPPGLDLERAAGFDPLGGMQNHTAELTRALDAKGVRQTVITAFRPGAPALERIGSTEIHRLGPVSYTHLTLPTIYSV